MEDLQRAAVAKGSPAQNPIREFPASDYGALRAAEGCAALPWSSNIAPGSRVLHRSGRSAPGQTNGRVILVLGF